MDPGRLNKRIEIYANIEKENEIGQVNYKTELFKSVRASIKAKARSEQQADKKNDKTTYTIIIRYIKGLSEDMTIMYEGKKLEIYQIIDIDERHKFLEIMAVYKG